MVATPKLLATLVVILLIMPAALLAGQVELSANRNVITLGDTVMLTVKTLGENPKIKSIQMQPKVSLHQAGTQTSVNMINGSVSRSATTSFRFAPPNPGTYLIGPVEVQVGNKIVHSNRIQVIVQPPGTERHLQISAQTTPKTVYEGQPILFEVIVEHGAGYTPTGWTPPAANGVQGFKGQKETTNSGSSIQRGEHTYQQITIRDWRVSTAAGQYVLQNGSMEVQKPQEKTRSRRRDPFAGFFGNSPAVASFAIPTTSFTVLPLPTVPRHLNFSGALGLLSTRWAPQSRSSNKQRGILHIQGPGNSVAFNISPWVQNGWKAYPDKAQIVHSLKNNKPFINIDVPLTLVPTNETPSAMPAWFDLSSQQYKPFQIAFKQAPGVVEQAIPSKAVDSNLVDNPENTNDALQTIHPNSWAQYLQLRWTRLALLLIWCATLALYLTRLRPSRQSLGHNAQQIQQQIYQAVKKDKQTQWEDLYQLIHQANLNEFAAYEKALGDALFGPVYRSPSASIQALLTQDQSQGFAPAHKASSNDKPEVDAS